MKARKIYVRKYHPINLIQLPHGYNITLKRYNKFQQIYVVKDLSNLNQYSTIVNIQELKAFIMQNLNNSQNRQKSENDIKIGNFENNPILSRYFNL